MKVRFSNKLESFVRCEEQLWLDCGGPSNTFLPPDTVRGGKATQTYSFHPFWDVPSGGCGFLGPRATLCQGRQGGPVSANNLRARLRREVREPPLLGAPPSEHKVAHLGLGL